MGLSCYLGSRFICQRVTPFLRRLFTRFVGGHRSIPLFKRADAWLAYCPIQPLAYCFIKRDHYWVGQHAS